MDKFFIYIGISTTFTIGVLSFYILIRLIMDSRKRKKRNQDNKEYPDIKFTEKYIVQTITLEDLIDSCILVGDVMFIKI